MKGLIVALIIAATAVTPLVVAAQAPAEKPTPLSAESLARLEKLALEQRVRFLEMEAAQRAYQDKLREGDIAIAEEAAKAKLDPKAYRPDLGAKAWRKVGP